VTFNTLPNRLATPLSRKSPVRRAKDFVASGTAAVVGAVYKGDSAPRQQPSRSFLRRIEDFSANMKNRMESNGCLCG
jgi:hypothetical protein